MITKWAGNQKDSVRAGPSGLCPPPLIPKAPSSNMDIIKVSSKCPERQQITEEELEKALEVDTKDLSKRGNAESQESFGSLVVFL